MSHPSDGSEWGGAGFIVSRTERQLERGGRPAIFFFFSSRRRHTRFDCDWSSDVCSSDLDYWRDRALIAHELVHVLQYHRLGGVLPFLQTYICQCATVGYPNAPLELEEIGRASCRERV